MKKLNLILLIALTGFSSILFSGCSKEEITASVTFKEVNVNDVNGDVTGNGGSATEVYTWSNSQATADYNCDITGTKGGTFQMTIKDADGTTVLDVTLVGGQEPDSKSGVTATGVPGDWIVTIQLTTFNGDGSFSLTAGN